MNGDNFKSNFMKFLTFLFCIFFSFSYSQSFIIGDSQSFYLSQNSKFATLYKPLAKSGIGVAELIQMLKNSPVDYEAKNIFISIGVNDDYNDRGINTLIQNLDNVFPNSYFFVIQGSFGWGNVMNINSQSKRYIDYYNTFRKAKIFVIQQSVGYGDPHFNKPEYRAISNFIDYIIYKNSEREKK
jgi:hypothetical protein